ncbi:MAG: DUF4339 domain-containing protein [Sediminibacterium sp.]|nr:DUF4339 domain-containing protein [Sediminibacterium sp.]
MEYYYSDGLNQYGPFTIDELKDKNVAQTTLIWYKGEDIWKPLQEYPELMLQLSDYIEQPANASVPPPLPTVHRISHNKSGTLIFLYCWTAFHLFALLMSYSGIAIFNQGIPESNKFWPFIKIWEEKWNGWAGRRPIGYYTDFNGIFYNYDWTEFIFYVGFAWIIFFIYSQSEKFSYNKTKEKNYDDDKQESDLIPLDCFCNIWFFGDCSTLFRVEAVAKVIKVECLVNVCPISLPINCLP